MTRQSRGQRYGAQDRDLLLVLDRIATSFLHRAHHVNNAGFRDLNHVMRLNERVGVVVVGRQKHVSHRDFDFLSRRGWSRFAHGRAWAGERRAGGRPCPGTARPPRDGDRVTDVLCQPARHGQDFQQPAAALKLVHARALDRAENADRLAAKLADHDANLRIAEVAALIHLLEFGFDLPGGDSRDRELLDQRRGNRPPRADHDRVAEFLDFKNGYAQYVARTDKIDAVHADRGLGRIGGL